MDSSRISGISLQPQDRDFALLRGLFESRVMTVGHIAMLYFDGKREYAKKRLQKIKAAGLISERTRRVNEPSILFLTRKAFDLLNSQGQLSGYPALGGTSFEARSNVSELTLRHELEIMDVKAALHSALAESKQFSIVEFSTWPLIYQFEASRPIDGANTLVKPDGFIRIHEKEPGTKGFAYDCFLEVDRSTEAQDALVSKAGCYREFYKSGSFAARNGAPRTDFKSFPFRVLMVLKSDERRNNTTERLLHHNPPILTQVWLTTFAEVTADPLGAIWILPMDYRKLTLDTQFYRETPNRRSEYRRQPERDTFIESKIQKRRLLEGEAASEDPDTHQQMQRNPHLGKA
jgi:hypothetical protein